MQETSREAWKASFVAIDPRDHDDGQKVAMEHDRRVGNPTALLASLAASINASEPPSAFVLEVAEISDAESSMDFVRAYDGTITNVSFELIAPNMFGVRSELDEEMRELRDSEKARRARLELQNRDGLAFDNARVAETARYAAEGGGRVRAKDGAKAVFHSRDNVRNANIEVNPKRDGEANVFRRIFARMFPE